MTDLIKQHEWKVITFLFLALIASTFWGFSQCIGECSWLTDQPRSIWDQSFFTLQMLVMNYGGIHGSEAPWQMQLPRFGLPLLASYSLFKGLVTLLSYRQKQFRVRFWSDHIVIFGGNDQTKSLINAYLSKPNPPKVLVIDSVDNQNFVDIQASGVAFLIEDYRLHNTLKNIRLSKAQCIYIMTDSDQTNLEILNKIDILFQQNANPTKTISEIKLFVHVHEDSLRKQISQKLRNDDEKWKGRSVSVRTFSTWENSARALLTGIHAPHQNFQAGVQPHMLILGHSNLVEQLIIWGARLGHYPCGKKLRITYVDENAGKLRDSIVARYPVLDSVSHAHMGWDAHELPLLPVIDIEYISTPAESFTGEIYAEIIAKGPISSAYICLEEMKIEVVSKIASALIAQSGKSAMLDSHPLIVLCDVGGRGQLLKSDTGINLQIFDVDSEGVKMKEGEMHIEGVREIWAKAINDYYSKLYSDNATPWDELPEDLRNSSRQSADHWEIKFDCLRSQAGANESFDPESHQDTLMRLEHDRWCAERLMSGWRYADRPSTKEEEKISKDKRLSWCLCDFDDLSPEDQKKDEDVYQVAYLLMNS